MKHKLSIAEQIEVSLRTGNRDKQAKLDQINLNCQFVIDNSDNATLKQFAKVIQTMINADETRHIEA